MARRPWDAHAPQTAQNEQQRTEQLAQMVAAASPRDRDGSPLTTTLHLEAALHPDR